MVKAQPTIRAMGVDDWELYRDMRTRATREHPDFFLSNEEDSKALSKDDWLEPLLHPYKQVFGLFLEDEMIGITGIFQHKDDPSGESTIMAMNYIVPEYRGHGYARYFYEVRIAWAKEVGVFKKLITCHRQGNEASRRAILAAGFVYTGTCTGIFGDGSEDVELSYEMVL